MSTAYVERGPFLRIPSPRVGYVLADYNLRADAQTIVLDRSRYGNHGRYSGTSPQSGAPVAEVFAPVQGMFSFRNRAGEGRVAMISGGQFRLARVE